MEDGGLRKRIWLVRMQMHKAMEKTQNGTNQLVSLLLSLFIPAKQFISKIVRR